MRVSRLTHRDREARSADFPAALTVAPVPQIGDQLRRLARGILAYGRWPHRRRRQGRPRRSTTAREHRLVIAAMLWLTNSTVRPSVATSRILPRHFRWNSASPTASTSSTMRISLSQMRGNRKRQPHVHAAAVVLDRGVEELLDAGEGDDGVELLADLARASCRESRR